MLLDEEAAASLRSGQGLAELGVAALISVFLFDSGSTARLASDRLAHLITLGVDTNFLLSFNAIINDLSSWSGWMRPLARCFLEATCVPSSPLRIDCVLLGH